MGFAPNTITDVSISQSLILSSDSTTENTDELSFHNYDDDDSDAELEPFGYELLPQDEDEENKDDEIDDSDRERKLEFQPQILQIHTTDQEKISDDDVAIINSIMKSIKIPDSAVPEWARVIPEEAWLPMVINNDETSEDSNNYDIS